RRLVLIFHDQLRIGNQLLVAFGYIEWMLGVEGVTAADYEGGCGNRGQRFGAVERHRPDNGPDRIGHRVRVLVSFESLPDRLGNERSKTLFYRGSPVGSHETIDTVALQSVGKLIPASQRVLVARPRAQVRGGDLNQSRNPVGMFDRKCRRGRSAHRSA